MQVVLNRLRHPAFPKTVCGVVFQGAERSTGCQFTFTCDGALARQPSPLAWDRARKVAAAALAGAVYRPVGYATHYHTDWVVPYWSEPRQDRRGPHTPVLSLDRLVGHAPRLPPRRLRRRARRREAGRGIGRARHGRRAGGSGDRDRRRRAVSGHRARAAGGGAGHRALTGMKPDAFRTLADAACGPRERCRLMS
ncbi:cell wall hydrolase [Sphingomonas sp. MMS24-JH45]